MCKFFFSLLFAACSFYAGAHSGKARFHVLIDTDGAADDLRSICMLLCNREVEVLSVTTSEGALTTDVAARKVSALLNHFHHEGIPVGTGRSLGIPPPAWRKQSEAIHWGDTVQPVFRERQAADLICRTIENEEEKVIFIALGTLTNLNDALNMNPGLKKRIDYIIWYNSSVQTLQGANYEADRESAEKALAAGIDVFVVSGNEKFPLTIDDSYLEMIAAVNQPYVEKILETHRQSILVPVVASRHMKAWDDLAVIYLFAPDLFTTVQVRQTVSACSLADAPALEKAKQAIVQIFAGKPDSESRVFYGFPENPGLYAGDVAPVVSRLISLYGRSEWRAGVLTNELHGHLGIYAIIGVKMGIRAREYFNIGIDDMEVESYAGSQPPVSCLNDGLQVSTGATLGHGLIRIAPGQDIRPEASFTFKNKTIHIRLKPVYAQQIRRDVEECIRLYGGLTEDYWSGIRSLAIKYWEEFDRHIIFDIK
ncbi:MAG: nucleoside hydrolase [Dysgonamonadaceae bacterium]|jgi:pyrimidine-specific ribonucleoside hydrolase|nr:nucleoside hydrolase [Dysgonamonadaceae bacterium]